MFSLKNGSETIQGTPALLEHATSFYKKLFGPVEDAGVRLRDEIWDEEEKLNEDDRISLDRIFTEHEIHDILCQMEKISLIYNLALMESLWNFINVVGI
jgi:hypothetical protein